MFSKITLGSCLTSLPKDFEVDDADRLVLDIPKLTEQIINFICIIHNITSCNDILLNKF